MAKTKYAVIRKRFSENTSCHGLAQIYLSSTRWQRIFWITLSVTVFSFLIVQLVLRISEYLERNTTTAFSEEYVDSLPFPSITVCNFNQFFRLNSTMEREAIDALAEARFGYSGFDDINKTRIQYFDTVYNGSLQQYTMHKGWSLSHYWWCYVGDIECSNKNFTPVITNMGKCWTFHNDIPTKRAGSKFGVSIALDIEQEKYTEHPIYGNWEAGIRVQIHSRDEAPSVDELGLAVPAGQTAFISMHKREEAAMYKPWGDCDPNNEYLEYFDSYTMNNCLKDCLRRVMRDYCHCRLYIFDATYDYMAECNATQTIKCIIEMQDHKDLTADECGCQPPCKRVSYDTTISYATVINSETQKLLPNLTDDNIGRNMVGINVFFDRMSITKQTENKAITWTALLSDLGGQLGLWMGISVVTVFEIIQFFTANCAEASSQRKRKKTTKNNTEMAQRQDGRVATIS